MDKTKKRLLSMMSQSLCNCEFLQKKFEVDIEYLESLKYNFVGQYYKFSSITEHIIGGEHEEEIPEDISDSFNYFERKQISNFNEEYSPKKTHNQTDLSDSFDLRDKNLLHFNKFNNLVVKVVNSLTIERKLEAKKGVLNEEKKENQKNTKLVNYDILEYYKDGDGKNKENSNKRNENNISNREIQTLAKRKNKEYSELEKSIYLDKLIHFDKKNEEKSPIHSDSKKINDSQNQKKTPLTAQPSQSGHDQSLIIKKNKEEKDLKIEKKDNEKIQLNTNSKKPLISENSKLKEESKVTDEYNLTPTRNKNMDSTEKRDISPLPIKKNLENISKTPVKNEPKINKNESPIKMKTLDNEVHNDLKNKDKSSAIKNETEKLKVIQSNDKKTEIKKNIADEGKKSNDQKEVITKKGIEKNNEVNKEIKENENIKKPTSEIKHAVKKEETIKSKENKEEKVIKEKNLNNKNEVQTSKPENKNIENSTHKTTINEEKHIINKDDELKIKEDKKVKFSEQNKDDHSNKKTVEISNNQHSEMNEKSLIMKQDKDKIENITQSESNINQNFYESEINKIKPSENINSETKSNNVKVELEETKKVELKNETNTQINIKTQDEKLNLNVNKNDVNDQNNTERIIMNENKDNSKEIKLIEKISPNLDENEKLVPKTKSPVENKTEVKLDSQKINENSNLNSSAKQSSQDSDIKLLKKGENNEMKTEIKDNSLVKPVDTLYNNAEIKKENKIELNKAEVKEDSQLKQIISQAEKVDNNKEFTIKLQKTEKTADEPKNIEINEKVVIENQVNMIPNKTEIIETIPTIDLKISQIPEVPKNKNEKENIIISNEVKANNEENTNKSEINITQNSSTENPKSNSIQALSLTTLTEFLTNKKRLSIAINLRNFQQIKPLMINSIRKNLEKSIKNFDELANTYKNDEEVQHYLEKTFTPSKTSINGVNYVTPTEEQNFIKKAQTEQVTNFFKILYLFLKEDIESVPNEKIIENFINIIVPKYNCTSIKMFYLNHLMKNTSMNDEYFTKIQEMLNTYPKLLSPADMMKVNRSVSYMTFMVKELFEFYSMKAPDGTQIFKIREAIERSQKDREKIKHLE